MLAALREEDKQLANPNIELTQLVVSVLERLGYRVGSELIPTGEFPLFTVGQRIYNTDNQTKDKNETTHFLTLHAWSQGTSTFECETMTYEAVESLRALEGGETLNFYIDIVSVDSATTLIDSASTGLRKAEDINHGIIELEFQLTRKY